MAHGPRKGGKGHDKHAGSHRRFQLIAQNAGEQKKHHHAASRTDKAADKAHCHTAYHRLDEPLSALCRLHGFPGGHHRLYNKLNAQKQRHNHGKAAHGGVWHKAGNPASEQGKKQHRDHHHKTVADIQIFVFPVGVSAGRAGQNVAGKGDPHRLIGGKSQEGDQHGADHSRRAHPCKSRAQSGPDARHKTDKNFEYHSVSSSMQSPPRSPRQTQRLHQPDISGRLLLHVLMGYPIVQIYPSGDPPRAPGPAASPQPGKHPPAGV